MRKSVFKIFTAFAVLFVLSATAVFSIFTSCEIGLGHSVDTEPPTISIGSPSDSFIVRDNFTLSGTCDDDSGVTRIDIEFKNTENKSIVYTDFTPLVDLKNKTWSCEINTVKKDDNGNIIEHLITDGVYTITATAFDDSKKTNLASRTLTIDNTPPVVIVTSPITTSITSPTAYGQVFDFIASAADDNDITRFEIFFYDENGNYIQDSNVSFTDVSRQIDVTAATWQDAIYNKIYGTNKEAGTKAYYIGIKAFDDARKFPEQADDFGNSTNTFFLSSTFNYKAADAYKYLSGQSSAEERSVQSIKEAIDSSKQEKVTISLNPVNNPTFTVQNYDAYESNATVFETDDYKFTSGNKINITINQGRDNKAIKADTVGIYFVECDVDSNGALVEKENKITILNPYCDENGNVKKDSEGNPLISKEAHDAAITIGKDTVTFTSNIKSENDGGISGLALNKIYKIDVVAYDYNNIICHNSDVYAFKLVTTASAPVVGIDEPGNSTSIASSAAFDVKGSIQTAQTPSAITVRAYLNFDQDKPAENYFASSDSAESSAQNITKINLSVNDAKQNGRTWTIPFSFAVPKDKSKESKFAVVVAAIDDNNQIGSSKIDVSNDTQAPQFGEHTLSPYVDVETGSDENKTITKWVNGVVQIKQSVNDNNIVADTAYSFETSEYSEANKDKWIHLGQTTAMTFEYDSTADFVKGDSNKGNGKGTKTIYLWARDEAGNESKSTIILNVDQSTDEPKVELSNSHENIKTAEEIFKNEGQNIFGSDSNNQLMAMITDDDKIQSVAIEYVEGELWNEQSKQTLRTYNPDSATFNLKQTLPKKEGSYLIKITVVDTKASVEHTGYSTKVIGPYLIAIDNGAPQLDITTDNGGDSKNYKAKGGKFDIEGRLYDKTATLWRYSDKECTKDKTEIKPSKETNEYYAWKDTLTAGTEAKPTTYYYKAVDPYGQSTVKSYVFSVDPDAPTFLITNVEGDSADNPTKLSKDTAAAVQRYGKTTAYFTVKGTVTDGGNADISSGLESYIYYKVCKDGESPALAADKLSYDIQNWKTAPISNTKDGYIWEAPVSLADFNEGDTCVIYFAAKDKANNVSLIAENPSNKIKVTIDGTAPVIDQPVLKIGKEETTISISVKDAETGIDKVLLKLAGNDYKPENSYKVTNAVSAEDASKTVCTYTITNSKAKLSNGANTFTVAVTDKAGNTATSDEVVINNTAPVLSDVAISNAESLNKQGEYVLENSAFQIKGKVSLSETDNSNLLASVTWTDKTSDGTTLQSGTITTTSAFILDVNPENQIFKDYENQAVTRTFTATNVYGKTSTASVKFKTDIKAPTFEITNVEGDAANLNKDSQAITRFGTTQNYFTIKGTVTDGAESSSGLANNIYYKVCEQNEPEESQNDNYIIVETGDNKWNSAPITKAGNSYTWEAPISFKEKEEGKSYVIYLAAKDKANNVSKVSQNPSAKILVTIDGTAPVINKPVLRIGQKETVIQVIAKDAQSGIASAVLILSDKEFKTKTDSDFTKTEAPVQGEDNAGCTLYTYTFKNEAAGLSTGVNTFKVVVTDIAGNSATSDDIIINNNAPVLSNVAIKDANTRNKEGEYILENEAFEINGKVAISEKDKSNLLSKVTWKDTYTNGDSEETLKQGECSLENSNGKFALSIDPKGDYKEYENIQVTRTFTATNVYGKTSTASVKFKTDITQPVFVRNDVSSKIAGVQIDGTKLDKLAEKWSKSTTLPIKGSVKDNESGVEKITYKITPKEGVQSVEGEIYTSQVVEGDEVYYTFSGTNGSFVEGVTNSVQIFVTDKAGNTAELSTIPYVKIDLDSPVTTELSYKYEGDAAAVLYENAILTNKTKNIILSGKFSDEKTGVEKVAGLDEKEGSKAIVVNIDGKDYEAKLTPVEDGNYSSGTWSATINTKELGASGSHKAIVKITDKAGNIDSATNCYFKVDTDAPVVKIESPSATAQMNGLNTFSGKVIEGNNPKSIELYYLFSASAADESTLKNFANWKQAENSELKKSVGENNVSIADVSSWKFENINVNNFLGKETSGKLYILPVAYDEAGNCSIDTTKLVAATDKLQGWSCFDVDLDSDRPVIKFTNLSWDNESNNKAGGIKKYNKNLQTLTGTISDDDGISELRVAISDTQITKRPDDFLKDDKYKMPVNSGAFSIPLGEDGTKYLWVYVKDAAGGEFETAKLAKESSNKNLYQPYMIFDGHKDAAKAEIKSNNDSSITFAINSKAPQIKSRKFKTGESAEKTLASTAAELSETANYAGGTKYQYVQFELDADSAVPINSVNLSVTGVSNSINLTGDKGTWSTSAVDVMKWSEGAHTLTFTVTDMSGLATTETKQITIDKTGPEVKLTSPGEDDVTGEITLKGTSSDSLNDVESVGFVIVDNQYYSAQGKLLSGSEEKIKAAAKASVSLNKRVVGTSNKAWTFVLDGKNNAKLPVSEEGVADTTNGINLAPFAHKNNTDVRAVTLVFYAKDTFGNESWTPVSGTGAITINYDPFGDRPKTEITYPTGEFGSFANYTAGYSNVNGSIRVTGGATDNKSINSGAVFIQIDVNKDGKFDEKDSKLLKEKGYEIVEDVTSYKLGEGITNDASAITYRKETQWGILANGTNNWNYTLNAQGELKLDAASVGTGKYKIGVRSIALDSSGVFGSWSTASYFMIDMNAPSIASPQIVSDVTSDTSRAYQEDMYLRGTNYLKLTVKDLTGIKKLTYAVAKDTNSLADVSESNIVTVNFDKKLTSSSTTQKAGDGTVIKCVNPDTASSKKAENDMREYQVYIPASKLTKMSNAASVALKVTVYKDSDSESSNYERYVMNFDDTKPKIETGFGIKFNGIKADVNGAAVANRIMNSNGSYFTLGGKVEDNESGFERLAFYYYRDKQNSTTGENRRVFDVDPENQLGASGRTVYVSSLYSRTIEGTPIYGYEAYIGVEENGSVISLSGSSVSNKHIRAGGLVSINDVWHVISKKEGGKLTLSSPTTASDGTKAFFAIAQVVDNLGSEKTDANGDLTSSENGDDGDSMPESVVKAGNKWTFDASIHSNYIPDGPGTLVMFIWDKAGNVTVANYKASVQNNAPRLTKLWLGTDLSGNGNYSESSFVEYDVLSKVGAKSSYEMTTESYGKRYRVKGDMAVVAEFTGGNNAKNTTDGSRIKMVLNSGAESETNGYQQKNYYGTNMYTSNSTLAAQNWFEHSEGTSYTDLSNFAFKLSKDKLGADSSFANNVYSDRAMSFTFWDDTEETTQGTDSCYSYLKITDFIVMLDDNFAPTVAIDPFYWKSETDNSLYEYSYKNGHISLPGESISNAKFDKTTGLYKRNNNLYAGTNADRPKVSGTVSLRGSALDGHGLGSLWIAFNDSTGTYKIDTYNYLDVSGDGWEGAGNYYKLAKVTSNGWETISGTFNSATQQWTDYSSAAPDPWKFTILSDETTMEGHLVKWQLDIDTSKMEDGMGNNLSFMVMARDKAYTNSPTSSHQSGETASGSLSALGIYDLTVEGTNHPIYKVDVVPYISDIYDENNNPASRSRLGRFPVKAGAEFKIKGFNFGDTPTVERWRTGETRAAENLYASKDDVNTISVTAPENSGYLRLKIAGTYAANAYQETTSVVPYNIEAGYLASDTSTYGYNKANEAGTNFWRNDRYISVWNVAETSPFPGSINPHNGVIKKVTKENSGSGAPSSVNVGRDMAAAPAPGGGYLYKQQGYDTAVPPVTGMNDSYYAAMSSDDLKLYGYVSGRNYDAHGDNIAFNSSEVAYVAPVDEMDYTIVNGMPYYVFQDNGLGGDSGSVWGLGLVMMREGIWYDRTYFNPYKGNTIEEEKYPYFVERQGYNTASHKRDSSTGYDSVLYQFKNPRIAGWYNVKDSLQYTTKNGGARVTGVDYIYISYYDSYAKCLKYAAYRVGHRFATGDSKYANSKLNEWGKIDVSDDIDIVAEMTSSPMSSQNQKAQSEYNHMTDGASVVAGEDTTSSNPTNFSEIAGEWSDIFVDSTGINPHPVIIYYNKTKKCLEVAYGQNSFPQSTSEWTKSTIRPKGVNSDFGRYVSAAMDSRGNLHVAAQDADTSKLYYLYLTKAGSYYTVAKSVAVDASNGAGRWTDIELTNPNGYSIESIKPVISYIDTSFLGTTKGVKAAYVVGSTSDGTPIFEAMTDPARYAPNDQRTSVMPSVKETKNGSTVAPVAVGFNSDMLALDFLRDE